MYETEGEVMVKASLPGLKPEEVDITITGTTLCAVTAPRLSTSWSR